ncbi:MAG: hypothetical protein WD824_24835 [Cyclobacteriaceae bacterium]
MPMRFITTTGSVIAYYVTGLICMLIIHLIIGWENRVLMPRSFLVIILIGLCALPWVGLNITNLFCPVKPPQNLNELFIHGIFLLLIFGIVLKFR